MMNAREARKMRYLVSSEAMWYKGCLDGRCVDLLDRNGLQKPEVYLMV